MDETETLTVQTVRRVNAKIIRNNEYSIEIVS